MPAGVRVLICGLALVVGAAAEAPLRATQTVFRSSVDLIPVYATVTTPDGKFATGLTKDDFTLLDNGQPQEIVSFSEAASAISVSLILDTSSSMRAALPRVFAAAGQFLDLLRPFDRAMVGSLFYQGPAFTSDKERLRASLGLLPPDEGSPVWIALDRAVTALSRESNRRVIVIYTDGRDADHGHFKALKVSDATVRTRLEASGIMMYVVGFEGIKLGNAVKTMARRSGGRVTELGTSDDLGAALGDVAAELHHQYLLGFKPAAFDGSTHTLEVRVNRDDLTVRARQQYLAVK